MNFINRQRSQGNDALQVKRYTTQIYIIMEWVKAMVLFCSSLFWKLDLNPVQLLLFIFLFVIQYLGFPLR